ncbi:FAD:protein FMN transferase [Cryobacterium soli]|uniref:FAD:protein FMN transferase n=1 Tax=Cryobacterium soli TaxID=2220095 RepID=UPI000E75518F|nr:FAD:protein FMN transferase [Cryobacterium soli]
MTHTPTRGTPLTPVSDLTPGPLPTVPARTASRDWTLWSTSARLVVTDPDQIGLAATLADALLADVDRAASRFRTDSELQLVAGRLHAGVEVSNTLADLVRQALASAALTDGDVDPTLGYALDAVGYDRDIRLVEDHGVPVRAVVSRRPGWKSVSLVGNRLRVPAHLALDLGATAKAVAADWTATVISAALGCGVLLSLGGDIATAGPAPEGGWQVRVQDAPADPAATVTLVPGMALATSSTQHRRWTMAGQTQHHILNPRTGRPAEPVWRSVTVAASSCHRANTLSTAAIVRGTAALPWLCQLGTAARLVDVTGSVTVLGGWPAEPEPEPTRGERASAHTLEVRRPSDRPARYQDGTPIGHERRRVVA